MQRGPPAHLVHKDRLVRRGPRVIPVPQVRWARRVLPAQLGRLAQLEQWDRKDLQVHKGRRVTRVQQARLDPRAQPERRVPKVCKGLWAT